MDKITKNVSVMCFHDELCQVFNALMTALSLLRAWTDTAVRNRHSSSGDATGVISPQHTAVAARQAGTLHPLAALTLRNCPLPGRRPCKISRRRRGNQGR